MKGKLLTFLAKIGILGRENVYYIGGADVLPPPLKELPPSVFAQGRFFRIEGV